MAEKYCNLSTMKIQIYHNQEDTLLLYNLSLKFHYHSRCCECGTTMVIPDPRSVDSCTVAWLLKRFVKVRLNRLISDKTWDNRAFVWCCASRCCAASSRRASRRSSLLLMARFSSRRSNRRHTSWSSPGITEPSRRFGDLVDPLAMEAVTGGSSISSFGSSV